MLKTAKQLSNQRKHQGRRCITTHFVYESGTLQTEQRKGILDTYARVSHHVGHLRLNREHRFNTLTPNFLKSIRRSLNSLNADDLVKIIYMTGGKGEHFSNGTDFRTLLHYNKEKNEAKIASYLEDLYGLQIQTAKLNKPLIGVAPGHSFNSGATFLQATGLPTVTLDSKLAFNEVSFGFIPHGGSSFYLSRLPGEIGTFLALTGLPITGVDAKEFGMAQQLVHNSASYEEEIEDILLSMEFPIPNSQTMSNFGRQNPWHDELKQRHASNEEAERAKMVRETRAKHENLIHEEFMEPKDKRPSLTAESDAAYETMLKTYNERFEGSQEKGYLEDHKEGLYQNYYNYIAGYVKSHSGHRYSADPRFSILLRNAQAIDRCFFPSTLEEIKHNLKREGTKFAQTCLDKMEANSELSMKLALKLLRDARTLDFKGALQNELTVALNKIGDKDFELGVSEILLKPHRGALTNPGFSKEATPEQVQSYFAPNPWSARIQLDVVEKALLPTRFYYERFSDQVRLWVNEDSTPQPEVREHFDFELKEALREQGIDIRDRALTIEAARKHMFDKEQAQRRQQAFVARMEQMMSDSKLREGYFTEAKERIDALEQGPEFYKLVNRQIQAIFENAYIEKLQTIFEKSQEAHSLEKRRMLIRFKKFLFQSRILTFHQQELDRLMTIVNRLPFKEVHLTESWDVSFRDQEHPHLKHSFLWQLSRCIGKASLAPPELAKAYLTDPKTAKSLTVYTFDRAELQKLRDDLLANPAKYEQLLKMPALKQEALGDKQRMREKKREEYDYWFRVMNEGVLPSDSLPYYKQLVAYKDFASQVEERAYETLKLTVQRLMLDFEEQEGLNVVAEFAEGDKETKHKALKRLIALVNDQEKAAKDKKPKKQVADKKLIQESTNTKEIKIQINKLLSEDIEIKALLPEANAKNNPITKFREELLGELYQVIEFVLINSASKDRAGPSIPPKHILQERLASLTSPINGQQENVTHLRVLDSFLSDHNSEAIVKDAIRLAKPYFFETVVRGLLEREAVRVFDSFKAEATSNEVMLYYMFNHEYPHARLSPIMRKLTTFNEERDRDQYISAIFPDLSDSYAVKAYTSMMGHGTPTDNAALLEDATRRQYQELKDLKKQIQEKEEVWQKQSAESRERSLKTVFDNDDVDKEVDRFDSTKSVYQYDAHELEQFADYTQRAENLKDFLEFNGTSIRLTMENQDWLHMFGSAIAHYGMDMNAIFRYTTSTDDKSAHGQTTAEQYLKEMRARFGDQGLTWQDMGDYALFLSALHDAGVRAQQGAQESYQELSEAIVGQLAIVNGEDLARSQSVYETIKKSRHSLKKVGIRGQNTRTIVKDFANLQKRLLESERLRTSVESLSTQAPRDVQEILQSVIKNHGNTAYLDFAELERVLLARDYEMLRTRLSQTLINKEHLIADLTKTGGKHFEKFLNSYMSTRLDVVSLADARATAASMTPSALFDDKLQAQILALFDFVEDSLRFVPHARREVMHLGDYIERHGYVAKSAQRRGDFMVDVLKNKIAEVLGRAEDLEGADFIDWEFAGLRTNPALHKEEEARVRGALDQGKGYSPEATSEHLLESGLNGRAAQDLGEAALVGVYNEVTGSLEQHDPKDYELEKVLRDARRLTQLRPESEYMRSYYENQLMRLYSSVEFDPASVEGLIQRYTEFRLRECLLDKEFAAKVRHGGNGHLYVKTLREQITDELRLSEPFKTSDISYENLPVETDIRTNVEGRYNMQDVNNLEKIGFDGQETALDKLLGEYFLQKRGQYVANNELLDQLNAQFGGPTATFEDGHPLKTKDHLQKNHDAFPFQGEPNLAFAHLQQNLKKDLIPSIASPDYTALMELDIATAQAIQGFKNGLGPNLRQTNNEVGDIPEYYNMFDVRKPVGKYVEDKLADLLQEVFNVRKNVEKTLSRNELLAYDRALAQHLTREILIPRLRSACEADRNELLQLNQLGQMKKEGVEDEEFQGLKTPNKQGEFNKTLKNEDALYKFLAYSGMLEKTRRIDINKTRKNEVISMGVDNFEEFYKGELEKDFKRPPREIKPEEYQPKRGVDNAVAGEGFKTHADRKADYFREYELFKENKKEQLERNQLFFVLEQFFAKAKENPDPLNKAQEAIVEYFKDTENTFFFDKNKIQ